MSIPNINHVILTGRLTSDPDLRTLPSGGSVCHLRIAVNVLPLLCEVGRYL